MLPAMDPEAAYARAKTLFGKPDGRLAAIALLETASAAGHLPATFRLAEALLDGEAASQVRAVGLLRTAAAAGHARAAFRLGLLLATGGAGLERNLAEAAHWCERAANQGLAVAQFNLALLQAAGQGQGQGQDADPESTARWLRLASANGIAEADGCLEFIYQDDRETRPRTWDEAETRASIVHQRTDPGAPKSLRFAEYYVDPCLDLLARRLRLRRDENEDIVQQFFLELEEPLAKGAFRGRAWKEALREAYNQGRGDFRPFLGRALVNFARDWLHRRDHPLAPPMEVENDIEIQRDRWTAMLARFTAEVAPQRPDAARAVAVVNGLLAEDLGQTAMAARHQVSERTIRTDMRLGGELLCEWLRARIAALPGDSGGALLRGCELLPTWLNRPSAEKRTRALLFLALVDMVGARAEPDQGASS
jgi:hypothetical protein